GRRTLRQDVEHILGVFHSPSRRQTMTEHHFLTGVVHLRPENESATLCRRHDRPAGEGACDVDHILLGVSAVDAEGVQLEQFAPVVLIQALTLSLLLLLLWRTLHRHAHWPEDPADSTSIASRLPPPASR